MVGLLESKDLLEYNLVGVVCVEKKISKVADYVDYYIIDSDIINLNDLLKHINYVGNYLLEHMDGRFYWDYVITDIIKEDGKSFIKIDFRIYQKVEVG